MPAEGAVEADGGGLEGLPEGSLAGISVKYVEPRQLYSFTFQGEDGPKIALQVTVKQAGGSSEVAKRIAELCYAKCEAGGSKEDVGKYREELCKKHGGPSAGAKRSGARKPKSSAPPAKKAKKAGGRAGGGGLLEVLEREGRLEGALRIDGRLASKKNHESINGIFAVLPEGYDGHAAYEKVALGAEGLQSCKRFLFYAASGKKWKISDTLGDSKGGFCFLKASDGGAGPPLGGGGAAKWHVFDGKGEGYNADAAVRSELLPKSTKGAEEATDAGSSSSSSSSSSEDEAEAGDLDLPSQLSQPSQPSQPTAASAQPADSGARAAGRAAMPAEPEEPSRVCAKAAVRAGLRCPCHYAFAPDCPSRRL